MSNLSSSLEFDIVAEAFRVATGHMRPGKDAPASSADSYEVRSEVWRVWIAQNQKTVNAMLRAFETVVGVDA